MKVIFAGTPDFAAAALKAIAAAGFEIPLVLTQPNRPKGRDMQLITSPVKQAILELGLTVVQPEKLRSNAEALQILGDTGASIVMAAAYGLILPQKVLDAPKHGCLNIHASLLPRWHGMTPIQRAIEPDNAETGTCIIQTDIGLDTGAVTSEHRYAIQPMNTTNEMHDALMGLGAETIVTDLQRLQAGGRLNAVKQPKEGVTYAQELSKEETRVDWSQSADIIERKIRAFNPIPTTWIEYRDKPTRIQRTEMVAEQGRAGRVLSCTSGDLPMACGKSALNVTELQPSDSKRMNIQTFAAGRTVEVGAVL